MGLLDEVLTEVCGPGSAPDSHRTLATELAGMLSSGGMSTTS